ncbi:alpha/beta fold hydrolase [Thalassobacillus hwangdonensis]|uniref:Alpha/beta fold hydrolase n=1 Tax=Thalassobacillus hwangdonensis TaxID=546108 RepID=A0ABW3L3L0_9BACI
MPTLKHEDCTIYYDDMGRGIPIIFIHPPGMGRLVFLYQHPLADNYRLLIPDLSGHGQSSINRNPISIEGYAEEIVALMDHTGVQQAIICGYSAGGHVAHEVALRNPHRVRGLFLSGGYPKVESKLLQLEYALGMKMVEKNPDALIRVLARTHFSDTNIKQVISGQMRKTELRSWYYFYEASLQYDCTERLHEWDKPLHILYGNKVKWIKSHSPYYRNCKKACMMIIEKATHQLPTKHSHTFNRVLSDFVQSTCTQK